MSQEQQANQRFIFIPSNTIFLPKSVITKEKFESFKDPKKYGVWINGKRVGNDVLYSYKNTDFAQVSVSKLMKNAINYGKHVYQVDLMTNEYYHQYLDDVLARKDYMCVVNNKFKVENN